MASLILEPTTEGPYAIGETISFRLVGDDLPAVQGLFFDLTYNASLLSYQGAVFNSDFEPFFVIDRPEPPGATGVTTIADIQAGSFPAPDPSGDTTLVTVNFTVLSAGEVSVEIGPRMDGTFLEQGPNVPVVVDAPAPAEVTLSEPVNVPPVAVDDTGSTDEDSALTSGNVLGNDSDGDGGTLSVTAVNGVAANVGSPIVLASGAFLTLNANGSYDYDPNGAFEDLDTGESDTDSFAYTVSDGQGGSDTATVTITVNGVTDIVPNVPPVAVDDTGSTDEDSALTSGNVLGNDSDGDGGTLSVTAVNGVAANVGSPIVLASGAFLTLNANGSYDYDPNGAFEALNDGESDTDSFAYTVSDGQGGSDTATVTITVNGVTDIVPNVPPVAVDDMGSTDEDSALTSGNVLGNDSDGDGGTLSVTAVNGVAANVGSPIVLASGALLTLNANGSYDYDPNGAFEDLDTGESDTDSFAYTVSDGQGGSDTATVTITVNGVTDIVQPPQDFAGLLTIDRDGSLVTVTATSRDGVAALDGLLAFGNGAQATNFATRSFEGADTAGVVSGGVDFDLRTFAAPGLFDEFSFNLDPTATITAIGEFGVVFTGDPVDPGDPTRPTVALSATPLSGAEAGSTQIVLTVTASAPVTGDQSVALGLSGSATAADFVGGLPASITILDGERAGSATVTVADDSLVEGTETATFRVSTPTDGVQLGGATTVSVALTDNDVTPPPPQDFAGLLTIDRDGSLVTVTATSRDGVAALDGLLAFGNGAQATNFATRSFEGADTAGVVSGGVDFDLRTFAAPGLFDEFSFNLDPTATITAIGEFGVVFTGDPVDPGDPTRPTVALSATPLSGTEAGSTQIVLTVTASAAVTGDQSVALGLSGSATAADFVGGLPASITILDGERVGSATVTVADDSLVEGTETATFRVSTPSDGVQLGGATTVSVALTDNDVTPPPPQDFAGLLTIDRDGSLVTVTATSRDGVAALDGLLEFGNGAQATNFATRSFEGADTAGLVSGGVDFDLRTFAAPGLFDEFSFNLDPTATITAIGEFDVLFLA